MNFAKNLKEIMAERNLTQMAVANAIGVSQRTVSKWINRQSEPTATNLYNLAKFLQISSDCLIGLDINY